MMSIKRFPETQLLELLINNLRLSMRSLNHQSPHHSLHTKRKQHKAPHMECTRDTLEFPSGLDSSSVKHNFGQKITTFPSGVGPIYLSLRREEKPNEESGLKVTATINGTVC